MAFLDKKHAPLLRLVQLLHWKHFGQEFDPSTVNTLVEDLEREARSAGACTSHIDCAMDKVAEFHNQVSSIDFYSFFSFLNSACF